MEKAEERIHEADYWINIDRAGFGNGFWINIINKLKNKTAFLFYNELF